MKNPEFEERMSLLKDFVPSTSGTFESAYIKMEQRADEHVAKPKRTKAWIPISLSVCALAGTTIAIILLPHGGSIANSPIADLSKIPNGSRSFLTLTGLSDFIEDDFAKTNKESFALLGPSSEQPNMGHSFTLSYESVSDGVYLSPMVVESYYVYDETIGNLSDETKDVPYYSGAIKALFVPLSDSYTKNWSFEHGTSSGKNGIYDSYVNIYDSGKSVGTVYYTSDLLSIGWMNAYLKSNLI
jgi:hypothetical protein